jgi:hypothetical protein
MRTHVCPQLKFFARPFNADAWLTFGVKKTPVTKSLAVNAETWGVTRSTLLHLVFGVTGSTVSKNGILREA